MDATGEEEPKEVLFFPFYVPRNNSFIILYWDQSINKEGIIDDIREKRTKHWILNRILKVGELEYNVQEKVQVFAYYPPQSVLK